MKSILVVLLTALALLLGYFNLRQSQEAHTYRVENQNLLLEVEVLTNENEKLEKWNDKLKTLLDNDSPSIVLDSAGDILKTVTEDEVFLREKFASQRALAQLRKSINTRKRVIAQMFIRAGRQMGVPSPRTTEHTAM